MEDGKSAKSQGQSRLIRRSIQVLTLLELDLISGNVYLAVLRCLIDKTELGVSHPP